MESESHRCPKCGDGMEGGFALPSPGPTGPVQWFGGTWERGGTRSRGSDGTEIELRADRCRGCGFVEFYAK
jgi:hypothetical protein